MTIAKLCIIALAVFLAYTCVFFATLFAWRGLVNIKQFEKSNPKQFSDFLLKVGLICASLYMIAYSITSVLILVLLTIPFPGILDYFDSIRMVLLYACLLLSFITTAITIGVINKRMDNALLKNSRPK